MSCRAKLARKEPPGWMGDPAVSYSKGSGTVTIPVFTEGTGIKDVDATELGPAQGAGRHWEHKRLQRRSSVVVPGIKTQTQLGWSLKRRWKINECGTLKLFSKTSMKQDQESCSPTRQKL